MPTPSPRTKLSAVDIATITVAVLIGLITLALVLAGILTNAGISF